MPQNKAARGCFLSKKSSYNHRSICFNNVPVIRANLREHLGLLFDSKLDFLDQINEEKKKATEMLQKKLVITTFFFVNNI